MPKERSVVDINVAYESELANKRKQFLAGASKKDKRERIRSLTGMRLSENLPPTSVQNLASVQRKGYKIEKLLLTPAKGIALPALSFVPPQPNQKAYIYLHGQGKQADAAEGGKIESLVRSGSIVLAVDLRGMGETQRRDNRRISWTTGLFGPNYHETMLSYLLGQSMVGSRAEDVLVATHFLARYKPSTTNREIHLIGIGEAAIPALHAAALQPQQYASVRLQKMIRSWTEVVRAGESKNQLINTVHGALRFYDLPDLINLAGKEKVTLEQPHDVLGRAVGN